MPHLPMPETAYEYGKQWREDADWSTSRTSSEWRAGRGFGAHDCTTGRCDHPEHAAPVDDTPAIVSRVIARLKLTGERDAPDVLR